MRPLLTYRAALPVLVSAVLLVPDWGVSQAQALADLVLINGTVLTVDRADSVHQAVAIAGGKITAVGTSDQIKKLAGSTTEVIDLRGRTVTPGLIDTHVHFSEADALFTVDLGDAA